MGNFTKLMFGGINRDESRRENKRYNQMQDFYDSLDGGQYVIGDIMENNHEDTYASPWEDAYNSPWEDDCAKRYVDPPLPNPFSFISRLQKKIAFNKLKKEWIHHKKDVLKKKQNKKLYRYLQHKFNKLGKDLPYSIERWIYESN